MDGNYHVSDKENNPCCQWRGRTICDVTYPCNGQLSIGRRILASRQEVEIGRNFLCTAQRKQIVGQQNKQVSFKNGKGMLVGRGVLLSKVQTGDDVAGLILFPHQVVVCIEEVDASGHEEQNKDGQLLRECIGQAVRWSRNAVHRIDHIALNTARNAHMADQFNFNEDILCMNKKKFDKRNQSLDEHVDGKESSLPISTERVHACAKFSISRVDGLEKTIPKRKYSTTKRVAKDKGERRIGSSRKGITCKCGAGLEIESVLERMFTKIECRSYFNETIQSMGIR